MNRCVIIANHAAGRGRGHRLSDEARGAAIAGGMEPIVVHAGDVRIPELLVGAAAGVIVGGDGTLHHALDDLVAAAVPVWMFGAGTENLFARQWSMRAERDSLTRSLRALRVKTMDTATCNGRRFALMCSLGFDARVVERLVRGRRGPISHASYVLPIVRTIADDDVPTFTVRCDGREVVSARPGMVVIANSPEYGGRLNPAPNADPCDGRLDVVFVPHADGGEAILSLAAMRARIQPALKGWGAWKASNVEVVGHGKPATCQADGELMPFTSPVTIRTMPGTLKVLLPSP